MRTRRNLLLLGLGGAAVAAALASIPPYRLSIALQYLRTPRAAPPADEGEPFAAPEPWAARLIQAAEAQIGRTVAYDGSYRSIDYPRGDVPIDRGVCTDVLVRAYRDAFGIDLQKLVHEDMALAFADYPALWGLARPDPNIDHRRVPNLERFLTRQGAALAAGAEAARYLPGDIVTQRLPGNLPHLVIVSHRANAQRTRPLVVHNIGAGARLEDALFDFDIAGHFRFPPPA